MPSVKIPRKSTDTDMTPFVDIAFLILSFFIMATKFKPADPIKVETPQSVSAEKLKENDALLITISPDNKVYFTANQKTGKDMVDALIQNVNTARSLNLTQAEMANFKNAPVIGVPFASLKQLLDMPAKEMEKVQQPGIPVMDTLNNELVSWIQESKKAFAGKTLLYMIKGDNKSLYPTFEAVLFALKKNNELKYNLITAQEGAPVGTELYEERNK